MSTGKRIKIESKYRQSLTFLTNWNTPHFHALVLNRLRVSAILMHLYVMLQNIILYFFDKKLPRKYSWAYLHMEFLKIAIDLHMKTWSLCNRRC